jgi:CheY-like chemotaxis protein
LVLVIDDDQLTFDVLNRNLTDKGCRVEWAATGEAGLEAAKRLSPHVIVLDVIMPGMDGWSVLTSLKESPETQDIPVVMLTLLEQAELGVAMGAVDYLVKPVRAARLVSAIGRWLDTNRAELRVLVVEDDEALREIAERSLTGAGYGVQTACNGLQALEVMQSEVPDLIVLDLMMPEMDGFQFLHELRQRPQFDEIPVDVTTAKELTAQEQTLLQASAQRVIQKMAHSRSELLVQVERLIGQILATDRLPNQRRSIAAP